MAQELGKMPKPEAASFKDKKKLYVVPLVYTWAEAAKGYQELSTAIGSRSSTSWTTWNRASEPSSTSTTKRCSKAARPGSNRWKK